MINIENLEKILVKNWVKFIEPRQLLQYTQSLIEKQSQFCKVNKVSISRFEMIKNSFIIWVEFDSTQGKGTVELQLSNNELVHVQTILY